MNAKTLIAAALIAGAGSAAAQDNYFDWSQAGQPSLDPAPATTPATARGGLSVFPDRASFDAAGGGGLPIETFDGGLTGDAGVGSCGAVIDAVTVSPCFNAGDVIEGFTMTSVGANSQELVVLGTGFLGAGQTSDIAGSNSFGDATVIDFDPAVAAVGVDVYVGAPAPGDVTIEAFDGGGGSLGSFTITTAAADVPEFAGLISTIPVAQVVITGVGDSGELIDDLAFGSVLPEATEVPTLGIAGILALLLAVGIAGVLARRSLRAS